MRNLLILLIYTFFACSVFTENKADDITFKVTPELRLIIDQYDELINLSGINDYDYVICSSPWSNNKICIKASLSVSPPKYYLFYLDYHFDKKIYFVTGLEGLLEKTSTSSSQNQSDFVIFDPPVLCFEKTDDSTFAKCKDKQRCWHCADPPPPSSDTPVIKYQPND